MKKILFLVIGIMLIVPVATHAQVDQRCWIEEDCYKARQDMWGLSEAEARNPKAFRNDKTTQLMCDGLTLADNVTKIGFCLPATVATTKISIGGQQEFEGLAQFIAFVYEYGLSIASVIAILIIIFAGVQWTISGGSSEAISSAQHKIYGAIVGLIILAAAYTILYTVNPELVNLRPPDIWMINTQKIAAPYCGDITTTRVSKTPAFPTGRPLETAQRKAAYSALPPEDFVSPSLLDANGNAVTGLCGNDYFTERSGGLTCTGLACPSVNNQTQLCFDSNGDTFNECTPANIAGKIYSTDVVANFLNEAGGLARTVFGEGWTWPWVDTDDDDIDWFVACQNGDTDDEGHTETDHGIIVLDWRQGQNQNKKTYEQRYALREPNYQTGETYCSDKGGIKGWMLGVDFNESGDSVAAERHFIGKIPKNNSSAQINTLQTYRGYDLGAYSDTDTCMLINAGAEYLFTQEEIKRGIILDIDASSVADIDDAAEELQKAYPHAKSC